MVCRRLSETGGSAEMCSTKANRGAFCRGVSEWLPLLLPTLMLLMLCPWSCGLSGEGKMRNDVRFREEVLDDVEVGDDMGDDDDDASESPPLMWIMEARRLFAGRRKYRLELLFLLAAPSSSIFLRRQIQRLLDWVVYSGEGSCNA